VKFKSPHMKGCRVTSLDFVNPGGQSLLLCGSDDGIVRLYHNYHSRPNIVTAWRCLPELQPDDSGSGLVTCWNQSMGLLFTTGDVRIIRVWDAERETCLQDLNTKSTQAQTTLNSSADGQLIIGGGSDGVLRLFDRRVSNQQLHQLSQASGGTTSTMSSACQMTWNEHDTYIVKCSYGLQGQSGSNEDDWQRFKSISFDGCVRFWDLRMMNSIRQFKTDATRQTAAADFHPNLPLLVTGCQSQQLKLFKFDNSNNNINNGAGGNSDGSYELMHLNTIRSREGFLGQRIAPVSSVAVHPFRNLFASGGQEQYITLYGQ
jgi:regulatory associated protein of mTOR